VGHSWGICTAAKAARRGDVRGGAGPSHRCATVGTMFDIDVRAAAFQPLARSSPAGNWNQDGRRAVSVPQPRAAWSTAMAARPQRSSNASISILCASGISPGGPTGAWAPPHRAARTVEPAPSERPTTPTSDRPLRPRPTSVSDCPSAVIAVGLIRAWSWWSSLRSLLMTLAVR